MENLLTRYRNVCILAGVLFAQVLGLAIQVRRTGDESSRLIRVWAVNLITPLEKSIIWMQKGTGGVWQNYIYLRGVRQENRDLKMEIEHLRLERVRLSEDAEQARRLQSLLGFKEQFISKTLAAQVIGSSGSDLSHSVYIDKGSKDGVGQDMAVITSEGIVGKVLRVYGTTSQVLLINDPSSGVGAILEKSRIQGVLRGTSAGQVMLDKILSDETVQPGETLRTSGGDLVFPKGLPIGTVAKVNRTPETFLSVQIKPAANLSKLEEVLVVTQREERVPDVADKGTQRAADILARRLPSVPEKPPDTKATPNTPKSDAATDAAKPKSPAPVKPQENSPNGTVANGIIPIKKESASKPAQSVVKVSDDPSTQPITVTKPETAPAQPSPEQDNPR
jgi:rod shape-determining protein MreC